MQNTRTSRTQLALRFLALAGALLLTVANAGCSRKKDKLRFTTTPPATVTAGTNYSYRPAVSGSSGTVTYTLVTAPAGMTVSGGGVSWTPTSGDAGTHPITLRVASGSNATTQSWALEVLATTPPVPQSSPPQVAEGARDRRSRERTTAGSTLSSTSFGGPAGSATTDAPLFLFTFDPLEVPVASVAFEHALLATPETRGALLEEIGALTARVRPRRLSVGLTGRASDPASEELEWGAWLGFLADVATVARAAHPGTTVVNGVRPQRARTDAAAPIARLHSTRIRSGAIAPREMAPTFARSQ